MQTLARAASAVVSQTNERWLLLPQGMLRDARYAAVPQGDDIPQGDDNPQGI